MEDVLSLYREPYDPDRPLVCFDEHPVQLVAHVRDPRPAEPGTVAREDYHYERQGTKNLALLNARLRKYHNYDIQFLAGNNALAANSETG